MFSKKNELRIAIGTAGDEAMKLLQRKFWFFDRTCEITIGIHEGLIEVNCLAGTISLVITRGLALENKKFRTVSMTKTTFFLIHTDDSIQNIDSLVDAMRSWFSKKLNVI